MDQMSNSIVNTLLAISENSLEFTSKAPFKCAKVIVYVLQLFGYVYSQYETKTLTTPELNFLAQFTQLSPGTFALLQYGKNQLTLIFFYLMFSSHVLVYIVILCLSTRKQDQKSVIYQILNFFFMNFPWMFLTPLQEISVGVIVCGKNSFLTYNVELTECGENNPSIQYFVGVAGSLLVAFTGFVNVYFFRSYQFCQVDFLRKFSLVVYARIVLHQIIIICYYLALPSLDYVKHTLTHILLVNIVANAITKFPFGFSYEAKFFTCVMSGSEYLMIIISIWIFSDIDASMMFFSLIVYLPLIVTAILCLQERGRVSLYTQFESAKFNHNADVYLEETYRNAQLFYSSVYAKVLFIQIISQHTSNCKQLKCPCQQNTLLFFDATNNIEWDNLHNWVQYLFTQILQVSQLNRKFDDYEDFSLKYTTFLGKYKNNPTLSYGILQDIRFTSQNKNEGNKLQFSTSFYFSQIIQVLQNRNKVNIVANNAKHIQITSNEKYLFNDIFLLEDQGEHIKDEIIGLLSLQQNFWDRYLNGQIQSFDQLQISLFELQQQKQKCQELNDQLNYDDRYCSQLLIRFQIIYQTCCLKDYQQIIKQEKSLNQHLINEGLDTTSVFKSSMFLSNTCMSLIGRCSPQQCGTLKTNITKEFQSFFGYDSYDQSLSNICNLMPTYFGDIHNQFIQSYLFKGKSTYINGRFKSFMLNGQGFIEVIELSLSQYFPSISQETQFFLMTHIKKLNQQVSDSSDLHEEQSQDGVILLDAGFRIIGLTESVYSRVSSYLMKLTEPSHIMKYSNIFRMIPKLSQQLLQHYENQLQAGFTNITSQELFRSTDYMNINYDNKLSEILQTKSTKLTLKQRIKYINQIVDKIGTIQSVKSNTAVAIQYLIIQHVIKYYNQNEQQQLLYYELQITILGKEEYGLPSKKTTIKAKLQMLQNEQPLDTGRVVNSIDYLDKSDLPMLSKSVEEVNIYQEGSLSSMTTTNSVRLIHEFQHQVMRSRLPREFKQANYATGLFIASFIIILGLIFGAQINNQSQSFDCYETSQQYINYLSIYSQVMTTQLNQWNIQNINNQMQEGQLTHLSATQSSLITQNVLIDITTNQLQLLYSRWINYTDKQSEFNKLRDIIIDYSIVELLNYELNQLKSTNYTGSVLIFYNILDQYMHMAKESNYSEFQLKFTVFLINNYNNFQNAIAGHFEQCGQENIQSIDAFNVIVSLSYVLTTVLVIIIYCFSRMIQNKSRVILQIFYQTDQTQGFNELSAIQQFQRTLNNPYPWMNNKLFEDIMNQSMAYIDIAHTMTESVRDFKQQSTNSRRKAKLDKQQSQKYQSTRIMHISSQMNGLSMLLYYLFMALICYIYLLANQISNNVSLADAAVSIDKIDSIIKFRMNFTNAVISWQMFIELNNAIIEQDLILKALQSEQFNWTSNQQNFNDIKTNQFQQFIQIMTKSTMESDICNQFQCLNEQLYWEQRPLQQDYMLNFEAGLINPIQITLNLIDQYQGFQEAYQFNLVDLFLSNDYFTFFVFGNDILLYQIKVLVDRTFQQQQTINQTNNYDNMLISVISGVILMVVVYTLLIYKLIMIVKRFKLLKLSLLFMPFHAQTKVNALNLLKNLNK